MIKMISRASEKVKPGVEAKNHPAVYNEQAGIAPRLPPLTLKTLDNE
ncbi:MAG: hypothetical protein LBD64_01915 [Odoribacteraceae bacterium]|nr:hypothetical protein [Odoribacteraceae bacterium]